MIVVLERSARGADVARQHRLDRTHIWTRAINGFAADLSEGTVEALRNDPRVAYIADAGQRFVESSEPALSWGIDRRRSRLRWGPSPIRRSRLRRSRSTTNAPIPGP